MRDVSDRIGPGAMPVCPLRDSEITEWEPVVLVTAHGSKGLAHDICAYDDDEAEGDA